MSATSFAICWLFSRRPPGTGRASSRRGRAFQGSRPGDPDARRFLETAPMRRSSIRWRLPVFASPVSVDTACRHRSRTRSNPLPLAGSQGRSPCIRRRSGKRRSASTRRIDDHSRGRSRLKRVSFILQKVSASLEGRRYRPVRALILFCYLAGSSAAQSAGRSFGLPTSFLFRGNLSFPRSPKRCDINAVFTRCDNLSVIARQICEHGA